MLIKCSCLYQPSVSVVLTFPWGTTQSHALLCLSPDGIEMSSWIICVLILFHVTSVLLVSYFNPMLPLALWKLRGTWRQKGDINNAVCLFLVLGSLVLILNSSVRPQLFRSCLTGSLASLILYCLPLLTSYCSLAPVPEGGQGKENEVKSNL